MLCCSEGCFRVAVDLDHVGETVHSVGREHERRPGIKLAIDLGFVFWPEIGGNVGQVAKVASDDADGHCKAAGVMALGRGGMLTLWGWSSRTQRWPRS